MLLSPKSKKTKKCVCCTNLYFTYGIFVIDIDIDLGALVPRTIPSDLTTPDTAVDVGLNSSGSEAGTSSGGFPGAAVVNSVETKPAICIDPTFYADHHQVVGALMRTLDTMRILTVEKFQTEPLMARECIVVHITCFFLKMHNFQCKNVNCKKLKRSKLAIRTKSTRNG